MRANVRTTALLIFLLALPWQTRWIVGETMVLGEPSEYGRISVYVFDVLALVVIAMFWRVFRLHAIRLQVADRTMRFLVGAVVGLVFFSFLSILWSSEPLVALATSIHLVLAVALLWIVMQDRTVHPLAVLSMLVLSMVVPSVLGWVQAAMQSVEARTMLGIAMHDPTVAGTSVVETVSGRWLRAYGSFPHPNMFGGFLAVGLFGAIVSSAFVRHRVWEQVYAIAAVLIAGALVLTFSRAAWLASVFGLFVLVVGLWWIGARTLVRRTRFALGLVCLVSLILGVSMRPMVFTRVQSEGRLEVRSQTERAYAWRDAWHVWTQTPQTVLFGVGIGNYTFALERASPLRPVYAYQPVHSVPFLILVELGIVGLVGVLGLVGIADVRVHRSWRRPASVIAMAFGTTVFVLGLFDHYLWTQASGVYFLAIFFAVLLRLGEGSVPLPKADEFL